MNPSFMSLSLFRAGQISGFGAQRARPHHCRSDRGAGQCSVGFGSVELAPGMSARHSIEADRLREPPRGVEPAAGRFTTPKQSFTLPIASRRRGAPARRNHERYPWRRHHV
jgi:hypothetical protein